MIVVGDDGHVKLILKEKFAIQFEMKDLRKLKYLLEIEVTYSKRDIFISYWKYGPDPREISKIDCEPPKLLYYKAIYF